MIEEPAQDPRVSVVVAVYNPGPLLDRLVDSLLWQTLPAGAYEVIFVDDGSTDGSQRRVDELARSHRHFSAIHIPNSGWPGRPRNLGIEASRGRYVYVVDHDDWLTPEALERLADRADRLGADVVIGKEVGHGFGVPLELFARNIDDAKLGVDPLQHLLTPHKLFRRSMLMEHGIRFPEGRRRLEDHHFVMQAYFAAHRIAVLADYPCYHWAERPERENATHSRIDPVGYYANMREILDIVDANTEPGPLRDRLYSHWYLSKTLHKLRGPRWQRPVLAPPASALLDEIASIVNDRFEPRLDAMLPVRYRITARAVRTRNRQLLGAGAALIDGLVAVVETTAVTVEGGRLDLGLTFVLADPEANPLRFTRRDGRLEWVPPAIMEAADCLEPGDLDVTESLEQASVTIVLRHRPSATFFEHQVPWPLTSQGDETLAKGRLDLSVDLEAVAAGGPLSRGTWDVFVNLACAGFARRLRVPGGEPPPVDVTAAMSAYVTTEGNLAVVVRRSDGPELVAAPPVPEVAKRGHPTSLRRAVLSIVPGPARRAARAVIHELRP